MKLNKDFLSSRMNIFPALGQSFQIQQLHWSATAPKGETTPDICLNLIQHFQNTIPILSLSNPASCSLTLSTDTTLFTSACVPHREKQRVFSNAKRDLKKITTQTFSRRRSPGRRVSFDSKLTAKHRQDQFGFCFFEGSHLLILSSKSSRCGHKRPASAVNPLGWSVFTG